MYHLDFEHYDSHEFVMNCRMQNYKIMMDILLQLGPDVIHSCDDKAFREACASGHRDVAEWLMREDDLDIHVLDDEPLIQAAQMGQTEIVNWLLGIDTFDRLVLHEAFLAAVMQMRSGLIFYVLGKEIGPESYLLPGPLLRWAKRIGLTWAHYETTHLARRDFRKRLMVFSGLGLLPEHEREVMGFM